MSNYNSNRARLYANIARCGALVDACLNAGEKDLISVRERGWTAVRLAERARTQGDAKQVETLRLAEKMSRLEWKAVYTIAERSLKELNYCTRLVKRDGRCAIEASGRRDAKLLVLIENKGPADGVSIQTDWANLADKSCLTLQKEFECRMSEQGVALGDDGDPEQRHCDPRGGQLIREAGSMHAADLATGILLHEENKATAYQGSRCHGPARKIVQKAKVR